MSSFQRSHFLLLPVLGLALLTGACGVPLAVTAGSYAADGALIVSSDKTSSDHLASMMSEKDCALWRVFRGRSVCKERDGTKDPYAVDYDEPQRSVSEDGVKYGPPLRSAADAPAASWDVAAYKSAPPPPVPAEPVTAVAEARPVQATPAQTTAPQTTVAPAIAPKTSKGKGVRSTKKPSRGPAAPAS